jgi:hypothetical protein
MPTKTHWTLNPKRWFENISPSAQKREKKDNLALPTTITVARTTSIRFNAAQVSRTKSNVKVTPVAVSHNAENSNAPASTLVTQLQLPPFTIRRERVAILLPSLSFNRPTTFVPIHTEPTIRRSGQCAEKLAIDTKRGVTQSVSLVISGPPRPENLPRNSLMETHAVSTSQHWLTDHSRQSYDPAVESSSPRRWSPGSSLLNDNGHLSSGIAGTSVVHKPSSKETPSMMKAISVESLTESETSLTHPQCLPIIHHYQIIANDNGPQRQTSPVSSTQSLCLEDVFEDSQTFSIGTVKRSQSSVVMDKSTEKRFRISQSPRAPPTDTELASGVPVTPDRLSVDHMDEFCSSPHHSIDSFVASCHSDDSLRPANDEECYARLPCGSSTEQINNNIQNDLRIIINGYLRPMVSSIGQNRSTKPHHRSKRAHVSNEDTELIIEDITDKLLSSIDYPIYTQHQRCC